MWGGCLCSVDEFPKPVAERGREECLPSSAIPGQVAPPGLRASRTLAGLPSSKQMKAGLFTAGGEPWAATAPGTGTEMAGTVEKGAQMFK